jgi:DNA-directed RNA polymerase subunit M/transcription elongation factor TFIIS
MVGTRKKKIPVKDVNSETIEITKLQNVNLNKIRKQFVTENSDDIKDKRILYALAEIDRDETKKMFLKYIKKKKIVDKIELGILEFTLVYAKINQLIDTLIPAVYLDKVNDILTNLDPKSSINNKTLCDLILEEKIIPNYVAFYSPAELHPENWKELIKKNEFRDYKAKNIATTDMFQCSKCKARKSTVSMMQTRSIDEPMTTYVTCVVCKHTFKY